MVVCNTSMLQMGPAGCSPSAIHPYPPSLCSLTPLTCNQRYPPTTILSAGQILTPTSIPGLPSTPPMLRCNTSLSSATNSASSSPDSSVSMCSVFQPSSGVLTSNFVPPSSGVITSNFVPPSSGVLTSNFIPPSSVPSGVLTSNLVPYTTVSISNGVPQLIPINQGLVQYSPKLGNMVQCNQDMYTSNSGYNNQRIVNGSSVLQCAPRVCQLTPTGMLPSGAVEMCPVPPPTPLMPSNDVFSLMPLPPNLCSATPASSWKQSYGMEHVWQSEFRTLFNYYLNHMWMLLPVVQKPIGIWNANVDSAKVRFCCEDCGHGWTSMKGRVAFWFVLNPTTGEGLVCLKLYGQQCDRCKTGNYEPAMWYPEEVMKVLVNIYNRVGEVYYGFHQAPYHRARRAGKPRTPHNSDLCQACKDGVCAERK